MAINIRNGLLKGFEQALAEMPGDNPFVRDGDKTYMQYDQVRIGALLLNRTDVEVVFFWKGVAIYTMQHDLSDGLELTIDGISGRVPVSFTK